jgi:hypothetical protein
MGLMEWIEQINANAGDLAGNRYDGMGLLSDVGSNIKDWRKRMESAQAATRSVMPEVRQQGEAELRSLLEPLAGFGGSMQVAGTKIAPFVKQGLLGQFETTTPGRIINKTNANQGYSVNLPTGNLPAEGLMMGVYRNSDPRNVVTDKLSRSILDNFAETNKVPLSSESKYLGTWKNTDNGKTYVDVSRLFPESELRQATKFGERTGQLAGYNVGKKAEIPVGNWNDFVRSPEFAGRLDDMAQEGRQYLNQFPNQGQWWDMHGGPFERIYGTQHMPQVAGYTASTAPNSAPRENLQTMSEYMRRQIKGEPILQPDWRVPAGEMTRQEGKKIGMEQSRAANLTKTSKGLLDQLRQDKVREEALAMMGDPGAVVLDRHWARLAENPKAGIFTAAQEGIIEPGKQYMTLKDVISEHAQRLGQEPRNFSADVWTGIREHIKNNSDLYGQKFRGSAITGDSKSYADHFEELIRDKAKHLGITQQEMEKRLRSGDATLMSSLLASPLIASIYGKLYGEQQYD